MASTDGKPLGFLYCTRADFNLRVGISPTWAVNLPNRSFSSLDGAVVNDFIDGGIGCEMLTTAIPATTP
jgi:hypothetical protein